MPVWGLYMRKIYDDPDLSKIYRDDVRFEMPEDYEKYVQENKSNVQNNSGIESNVDGNEFNNYNNNDDIQEGDY